MGLKGVGKGNLILYDKRIEELSSIFNPKKITHAKIEVHDGVESFQKLSSYDILIIVVSDLKNLEEMKLKMILEDLRIVEKRIENSRKRGGNKEVKFFSKLKEYLENEQFLSSIKLEQSELLFLSGITFITQKPFIYDYLVSNLKLEEEAMSLGEEEKKEILFSYGFEPIFEKIVLFFTVGEKEVRSWILRKGQTVKKAAGKIHSDLEKGFVRAEVISYEEFMKIKDMRLAKERGLVRIERKDYLSI